MLTNYAKFPKAAAVLKLNSYWIIWFRKRLRSRKPLKAEVKGLQKLLGMTVFRRFLHQVLSGFQKPNNMDTSGFQKLFYCRTSNIQEN
jgi:hypothetical protein